MNSSLVEYPQRLRELYKEIAFADEHTWPDRLDTLDADQLCEVQRMAGSAADQRLPPHIDQAWQRHNSLGPCDGTASYRNFAP
jgi:hypothetical protein